MDETTAYWVAVQSVTRPLKAFGPFTYNQARDKRASLRSAFRANQISAIFPAAGQANADGCARFFMPSP